MHSKIIAILSLVTVSACVHTSQMPERDAQLMPKLASIIETQSAKRQRVSGRYQANATGIKQFLGRVDVTIALQQPASFYFSIPSFFGMAARVVSSDGERFYLLDMTGLGPTYMTRPADADTLEAWLSFPLEPKEFVHALLGVVDLEGATVVDAFSIKSDNKAELRLRYPTGKTKIVEFNATTDDLISQRAFDNDKLLYSVSYADFRETPKGRFPWRSQISVQTKKELVELVMRGEELEFNDEPYGKTTFQIEEP